MQKKMTLVEMITAAEANDDLDALDRLLEEGFEPLPEGEGPLKPYGARVRVRAEFAAEHPDSGFESAQLLNAATRDHAAR